MKAFKVAYKVVRYNSKEIYKGFGLKKRRTRIGMHAKNLNLLNSIPLSSPCSLVTYPQYQFIIKILDFCLDN